MNLLDSITQLRSMLDMILTAKDPAQFPDPVAFNSIVTKLNQLSASLENKKEEE